MRWHSINVSANCYGWQMESTELRELLTPEGLPAAVDRCPRGSRGSDVVASVAALRKAGHSPVLVAAVLNQARLRAEAAAKFGPFAASHAVHERRPRAGDPASRRCAARGQVPGCRPRLGSSTSAAESAPMRSRWPPSTSRSPRSSATRSRPRSPPTTSPRGRTHASCTPTPSTSTSPTSTPSGSTPLGATTSRRLSDPADWSPSLDFAFGLAARLPVGVKLGPGIDRDAHSGRLRGTVGVRRPRGRRARRVVRSARPPGHRSRRPRHRRARQRRAHRRGRQRGCRGRRARGVRVRARRLRHPGPAHRRSRARARGHACSTRRSPT